VNPVSGLWHCMCVGCTANVLGSLLSPFSRWRDSPVAPVSAYSTSPS